MEKKESLVWGMTRREIHCAESRAQEKKHGKKVKDDGYRSHI